MRRSSFGSILALLPALALMLPPTPAEAQRGPAARGALAARSAPAPRAAAPAPLAVFRPAQHVARAIGVATRQFRVAGEHQLGFTPAQARRNIVTRGIDLNALAGIRFRVGDVELQGQRLCQPCAHLERLSPGTLRPLVHRGGLRADLLTGGTIHVGATVAR